MSPGVVAFILTAVVLPLAISEGRDWCPRLAVRLVRWAARRLGDPQARDRYAEEWAANIQAVPGKLSPLVSAFGYLITLPRMRWTLRRPVLLNGRRETLAQAIHADYARRQREQGASPDDPALAVWEALPKALRASNRAQAADLENKLRTVGCELVPAIDWDSPPLPFTEAEVVHLAALEHQRWEAERRQDGWQPGPVRDPARKLSPHLMPWENLTEDIKDLDRDAIRALPTLLARAGFAIIRRTPPPRSTGTAPHDPADTAAPGAPGK